jgi:chitinase
VIISVGGNGEAGKGFLALTQRKTAQQNFISNIVNYVERYGLDGVDIDWEYWTYQNVEGRGGNDPIESQRLVNLLKALRAKLPADKLLTVDIFVGDWLGLQYLAEIEKSVDYVNVMAYDFTGAWPESPIGHHADYATFKRALAFAQAQGFSRDKLIVGLPTYGIEFENGGTTSIKHWAYRDILERISQANRTAASLERGRDDHLYFETPALITQKAQLIQRGGYAGAMIFELTGDSLSPKTSLLKRVYDTLQAPGCQSE